MIKKHIVSDSSQIYFDFGKAESSFIWDKDGKKLPAFPDMFKGDVVLNQIISIEDYFTHNITKTYLLESEDGGEGDLAPLLDRCKTLLAEKKLLTFTYAYYETPFPEVATLIPVDKHIVVTVGTPAPLLWAKLSSNLPELFSEDESEEEEEPEFGGFW